MSEEALGVLRTVGVRQEAGNQEDSCQDAGGLDKGVETLGRKN